MSNVPSVPITQPTPTEHSTLQPMPGITADEMTNDVSHFAVFHQSNPCGRLPGLIVTLPDDQMTHVQLIANPNNDVCRYVQF